MTSYVAKEQNGFVQGAPVNANNDYIDEFQLTQQAYARRSRFIAEQLSGLVAKFKKQRQATAAKAALYEMSDRELKDIGLTRAEIDQAVDGTVKSASVRGEGFWRKLGRKFIEAQQARAAYVQLMAMNSRELADIGLSRGEIEAAVNGKLQLRANDNVALPANLNDHRKAV
ncbi:MAG: hypothetical protein CMN55_15545 [Sneathiella sp.]|jgi:uncharacterized protein YjiS (DUF1127 family)|uniref:DUF1127 domain-containing protein n=1 Tax=Sneathiella sp. TaxID=1964365 RepID=UPI000C5FD892|nr:DUF1127 domain-containing protein [Sneathiella sp.]MAL80493.1 hypothetical protein [Sneathiella sp.]